MPASFFSLARPIARPKRRWLAAVVILMAAVVLFVIGPQIASPGFAMGSVVTSANYSTAISHHRRVEAEAPGRAAALSLAHHQKSEDHGLDETPGLIVGVYQLPNADFGPLCFSAQRVELTARNLIDQPNCRGPPAHSKGTQLLSLMPMPAILATGPAARNFRGRS